MAVYWIVSRGMSQFETTEVEYSSTFHYHSLVKKLKKVRVKFLLKLLGRRVLLKLQPSFTLQIECCVLQNKLVRTSRMLNRWKCLKNELDIALEIELAFSCQKHSEFDIPESQ